MSALTLLALGAMSVLAGLAVLLGHVLRPAPPQLRVVITQLNASPRRPGPALEPAGGFPRWVPHAALAFAQRHLGAAEADLVILGRSRAQLAAAKLAWAAAGALAPVAVTGLLAVLGVHLPVAVPVLAALVLAVLAWLNPSLLLAADAGRAREEFRAALGAFLALVGLERKARGSPAEALEEASRVSGSRPFRLIHTEVLRAELAGQPPWDALRDLGRRLGVPELVNLADIVASAADGAAVFDTLLAEARSLRHADVTAQQTRAALAAERLTLPTVALFLCFAALLIYPAAVRLAGGS